MSRAETAVRLPRAPGPEEAALKHSAARLWEADRAQLMLRQPFVAMLAMRLDLVPVVDDRLDTACTDGERIFVDARFLHALSAADRAFVLAHEVWHCAARHLLRRGRREARRWNVAVDQEVNALLCDEGLRLPHDCVYRAEWHGLNAETVYTRLADDETGDLARGRSADQHELRVGFGEGESVRDPDLDCFDTNGDWGQWPARVVAVAQQIERQRGEMPAGIAQLVDGYRRAEVPWRRVLARFVTRTLGDERHWLPPSRRGIYRGLYLPSRRGWQLTLTVGIDTSGSTALHLPAFLGELIGLAASFGRYRLRLLFCDAAIQHERIVSDDAPWDPAELDFAGGGGTSLTPVFDRLESEAPPAALIYFTDGYGPAPRQAPAYPVLWALTPGGRRPAAWGESLWLAES
ncbi:DUF2201 family putative metallopeptidase [Salinisphaera hydrothermalis]|uniref:Metal-dependent peptidase n=1 Tax=Salinisphaera hydrothermalis (strain C41B8) TaxID=1304275 RepID=A0A084IIR2_SALHC|nr:VWA-like domain-containing protein [Salinisphaera hydrothermalis]KEZ76596.1 hypothetical protein C41B8_14310 [Salinisphaera hydrothermalis C41B8]